MKLSLERFLPILVRFLPIFLRSSYHAIELKNILNNIETAVREKKRINSD
jgi:hypothetical protein